MSSYTPLIDKDYFEKHLFINVHYAVLPRFRGYQGFYWCMINDEKEMGYSIFRINEVIDGGDIYFQHKLKITDDMDINFVRKYLDQHLVENISEYLWAIQNGQQPIKQNEDEAIYVCRRYPKDGRIDWNWSARLIFNHIRALTPPATPGAFSFYKDQKVVFLKARVIDRDYFCTIGKVVNITKEGSLYVKCADGVIEILEIQVGKDTCLPNKYIKVVGAQFENEDKE